MNDAQRFLQLRAALPVHHIGPIMAARTEASIDLSQVDDLATRVAARVQQIDDHTFRAPSAWHAEAWLLIMANLAAQAASKGPVPGMSLPFDPSLGAPLYRGQRNPDWGLTPTGFRLDDRAQEAAGHALSIFTIAMLELFKSPDNPMNSVYGHMAGGQHYGLDTTLLDFTPDPHVAVFFACLNADVSSDVVVYALPMATAMSLSPVLVLPPPWLHRVYRQRGCFLDCLESPDGVQLRSRCAFRIVFPADPQYQAHAAREAATLLVGDAWYESAISWAKRRALVGAPDVDQARRLASELQAACGPSPHALYFNRVDDIYWPFRVIDSVQWLSVKLIGGTLLYDSGALESLFAHNEALFRSIRGAQRFLTGQFGGDAMRVDHRLHAMDSIAIVLDSLDRRKAKSPEQRSRMPRWLGGT